MTHDLATYEPSSDLPVFEPKSADLATQWQEHIAYWRAHWEDAQQRLWTLAAIAASVESRYGQADVKRFAYEVQCSSTWVYRLAQLHRTWRELQPSQVLSVSHHFEAMKAPDPQAAIERAELENLSTRQLRAEIRNEVYKPHEPEHHGSDPGGELSTRLQHWYGFVKACPCDGCGTRQDIEAAHIQCIVSPKTGMVMRRSHKGLAAWATLSLCKGKCHKRIHEIDEEAWFSEMGWTPGYAYQLLVTKLLMFFVGDEGG